jgi:hypothetical protein
MNKLRRICCFLSAFLLLILSALAQTSGGTLRGVVTDNSGAVVPAATLNLAGNGFTRSAQSQADGSYAFPGLPPGQFTIRMTYPGFAPFEKAVTVSGPGTIQLPIQLVLSTEKQEVTVAAESGPAISVEPDNNATALVIKGDDLEALPDDPDDLSDALQALAGPGAGPNGGSLYIDGFTGGELPPKESIREIRINQNPFSAEFDRLGFGRIEILTKPGTDKFRGNLRVEDSDSTFNSRNPFASNKPNYSNRQLGVNFGGPINKRSSFFVDFNRRDVQDNAVTNARYLDNSSITTAIVTPLTNTFVAPRIDYQLSTNHTLTARFEERINSRDNAGLGRYNLPPPYSDLAYNTASNGQNFTMTETAVLSPRMINETRFQYSRNWNQSAGNEIPSINVSNAFVSGGNGLGNTYDQTHHFELQNYTSITLGAHTVRFGGRFRRNSDQSNSPQGFNGQFIFNGGIAPVLDASNQVVYNPDGSPQTAFLTSLQQYQRNLQLQAAVPKFSGAQIQALGGGPSQFTVQTGQPYVSLVRWDAGPFIQDDWRMRPNLTLSLGLRYETQNLFSDHKDIAPRFGFAWAPGKARNGRQKTVVRGGFGIFYDRINFSPFERAVLNNGVSQLQYTVYNPAFTYDFQALSQGQSAQAPALSVQNGVLYEGGQALSKLNPGENQTYLVDPNLRADSSLQTAIGVERQLPRNTTLAVNYTFNRSNHLAQTVPINTPVPGTYDPSKPKGPDNGVFPYGYAAGDLLAYESGGLLRQHMLMVNFNTRFSRRVTLFGNYSLAFAHDLPSVPTDPYNFAMDYGRSNLDRRHNVFISGNITAPLGLRFAPFINIRSGGPYDVLLGQDLFGNTYFNARAAFAPPGSACGGDIVCTPLGNFATNVNAAQLNNLVPRNYLTMAGLVSVNLRMYRVFGFGPTRGGNRNNRGAGSQGGQPGPGGPSGGPGGGGPAFAPGGGFGGGGGPRGGGGGGGRGGRGGGGGGAFGGNESTDHRYNVTVSIAATNLLNHFNPGGYQGVLSSPQFGEPTTVNTGFGGGGFQGGGGQGSTANNRRLEFQTRFTF